MYKTNDLIVVVSNPNHKTDKPFRQLKAGLKRVYKVKCLSRWRDHTRIVASEIKPDGKLVRYNWHFSLDEITPAGIREMKIEDFL